MGELTNMSRSHLCSRRKLEAVLATMPISASMHAAGVTYRLRFWPDVRTAYDVMETVYGLVKDPLEWDTLKEKGPFPLAVSNHILSFLKGDDQTKWELSKFKAATEEEYQQRIYAHARFQALELRGLYEAIMNDEDAQLHLGQVYHHQDIGFGFHVWLVGSFMPGRLNMEISQYPEPS